MQNLFLITSIAFFSWIIRNTLFWVELWQSKEYRLDRLVVHLRETIQGNRLLFSPVSLVKWIILVGYSAVVFNDTYLTYYYWIVAAVFIFEGLRVLWELKSGYKLRRPARTAKALCIVGLTLLFISVLYLLPMADLYVWFLVLDRLLFFIVALFVFFFAFPTEIYTDMKIQKARTIIQRHKKLLVIAVSGSYGKSSTKEFIAQVLEEKFSVVKTIGSNNTSISIANTILNYINEKTEIFVVEMGAYKLGEVAQLCDIAPPKISVTTSVSDQHLSLYGSVKNAIDTELELIHALPKDGLAIFNGNNSNTEKLYKKTKKKKILYSVIASPASQNEESPLRTAQLIHNEKADITATNVTQQKDGLIFDVLLKGKTVHVKTRLLGTHMVENVLPAIFLANYLGINTQSIKKAVGVLNPPSKTMIRKLSPNGVVLIDDTFNASPESVRAAMKYMVVYKKKKILVLMPLVELGKHGRLRHYEIGAQAAKACDYLFVTNKNFYYDIQKGIVDGKGRCQLKYVRVPQLVENIIGLTKKDDIVVFEGKEAGRVLQNLL